MNSQSQSNLTLAMFPTKRPTKRKCGIIDRESTLSVVAFKDGHRIRTEHRLSEHSAREGKSMQESLPMANPSQDKREIATETHVDEVDMPSASVSRRKTKASGMLHATSN
jgi:hypothetical protein